jgi:hypothetical protein
MALLFALVLVSSCSSRGSSRDELRDGARSLLPPASDVVDEVEGDCVELARSPSCVMVYYVADSRSSSERMAAIEDRARASGWDLWRKEEFDSGGVELRFRRGRLQAIVNIWWPNKASRCRLSPSRACADVIAVEDAP